MKNVLEEVIKSLAKKADEQKTALEAMQFTQAALNLANVRSSLVGANHTEVMTDIAADNYVKTQK